MVVARARREATRSPLENIVKNVTDNARVRVDALVFARWKSIARNVKLMVSVCCVCVVMSFEGGKESVGVVVL